MSLIEDLERNELIEVVNDFNFTTGTNIYWLHRYKNLPENQNKSRQQIRYELIDILRIPKLSESSFDKLWTKYMKLQHKLLSGEVKSKIDLHTKGN